LVFAGPDRVGVRRDGASTARVVSDWGVSRVTAPTRQPGSRLTLTWKLSADLQFVDEVRM
jgi:hypothetical protein